MSTPAEDLAVRLFQLSRHLMANPNLSAVVVHPDKLQIAWPGDDAASLLGWADSIPGASLVVQPIDGDSYVYVTGLIGSRVETVWTVVSGLHGYLTENGAKTLGALDVRVLRDFADGEGE